MSTINKDSNDSSDDDDTFFIIILPVTIVIFVSIFSYLFVGYMRLKKHLRNSGQVISALPFLILPDEQPEIRSPDGHLPPPAYNTIVETQYENNIEAAVNYHHPSLTNFSLETNNNNNNNPTTRRERRHRSGNRGSRPGNDRAPPHNARGVGGILISQAEVQQSGPPSTEMMLERPPPVYSIDCSTDVTHSIGINGRRDRRKEARLEHIAMNDIAPPPYSLSSEVTVN